ncbi:alpha/beta hydrolase fold domain-containing protein [Hirsutella rhossiliensis]|uniref:alcohol O-acetyltransferase n=1 Tax=Hirsutella rhossiliensis TaxID=111463 RepID=A0A9P8N1E3_9HYPO|nr:alpha/beta hydrolase fold domain-containing protein [Hirsutella rhossiliensis]KAH0965147.1 alpha/beta hydrolase fold domain-containing protein [Hirsutella rhossiliensis]
MEWLGQAKIEFTHAPSPMAIKEKDGTKTDLLQICEKNTPPCTLNPWLFNGHLQTLWTATKPHGPKIFYRRRIFEAEEKAFRGSFAVDFVVEPHEEHDKSLPWRTVHYTDEELKTMGSDDSKPMLVVLHGLCGGSHEVYLRSAIAPLLGEGGWEACVINSRGCAKSKLTSGILYNARTTWDVRQTVKWLRKTYPNRPLFAIGFSLGANILTNYCGEEGPNCLLKGAVICSNPFNLEISSKFLQGSLLGKEVYLRSMGSTMKELAVTNRKELEMYSDLDMAAIDKVTYLFEFDRAVQCPTWGYPTEDAYYRDSSSADSVLSIRIPFMALHATDDPIAIRQAIPYQEFRENPSTVLVTSSLGGHLCWFESGGGRWYPRPVCNFLNHMAFNVDLDSVKPLEDPQSMVKPLRNLKYDPMRRKLAVAQN